MTSATTVRQNVCFVSTRCQLLWFIWFSLCSAFSAPRKGMVHSSGKGPKSSYALVMPHLPIESLILLKKNRPVATSWTMTPADETAVSTRTTILQEPSGRILPADDNATTAVMVPNQQSSAEAAYKVLVWKKSLTASETTTTPTTTKDEQTDTLSQPSYSEWLERKAKEKEPNFNKAVQETKMPSYSTTRKRLRSNESSSIVVETANDVAELAFVAPELVVEAAAKPLTTTTTTTPKPKTKKQPIKDVPVTVVQPTCFNVVLTHCTADFDSLASAVGLAKLWAREEEVTSSLSFKGISNYDDNGPDKNADDNSDGNNRQFGGKNFRSGSHVPTFVVLPRGAHPGVQRFLALHKHLFPIRSLKSLPDDLSGLNRLALVDAQRRDRLGPAEGLLEHAKRIVVVDHHVDQDSDIPATDYVVDKVGSVSTLISEYLKDAGLELTEAEATLLALGIHADTGSLCFDSTTPRDAKALSWCLEQGASQNAIAEHAHTSLSSEQQSVLTQALININSTRVHGVTLSTVLLSADGFINGLAAVTQDALELSSSDIFLMGMVYEANSGGRRKTKQGHELLTSRLLTKRKKNAVPGYSESQQLSLLYTDAWKGGKDAMRRRQLRAAFDRKDIDGSGYLEREEVSAALASCGVIASEPAITTLMEKIDVDGNGKIDFEEFVEFAMDAENRQLQDKDESGKKGATTLILVGRVKAGVSLKAVKLNKLFERFGGGGHAKAASATVRLNEQGEAADLMQGLVDELVETSLQQQPTVGDFMTAPALCIKANMNEKQVEDLFTRYDVRALPVVDDDNQVIGLVSYKEVASAKQRLWNKEQKRLRREQEVRERGEELSDDEQKMILERQKSGTTVKAWMKQHVRTAEASMTMAEVESLLLENDVGCVPVVADGSQTLVGMVTRTDLLRQHRYYPSLHYHNKGFADSIANRRPIIELRKRLKKFDDLDA